jgi:hypothetical protein
MARLTPQNHTDWPSIAERCVHVNRITARAVGSSFNQWWRWRIWSRRPCVWSRVQYSCTFCFKPDGSFYWQIEPSATGGVLRTQSLTVECTVKGKIHVQRYRVHDRWADTILKKNYFTIRIDTAFGPSPDPGGRVISWPEKTYRYVEIVFILVSTLFFAMSLLLLPRSWDSTDRAREEVVKTGHFQASPNSS